MSNREKKAILAAITIGQSPRDDMTADLLRRLPPEISLVQYGALDGYTMEEAQRLYGCVPGEPVLVSRMRDGNQIRLCERHGEALVQACIDRAERDGAEAILLLCTGQFPALRHTVALIRPQPLEYDTAKSLADGRKIAVMVPDPEQVEPIGSRWRAHGMDVTVVSASPYLGLAGVEAAARTLRNSGAALLCLDCMGYTLEMKRAAAQASGLSVLLPRTLAASIAAELLCSQ